jgi:hypothetical protein
MKRSTVAVAALLLVAACRRGEARRTTDPGEPQVVALSVRTDPPGASVKVNGSSKSWKTPCDVADYSLRRGMLDVELSLEGYETLRRAIPYDGENPAYLEISLKPKAVAKDATEPAPAEAVPAPAPAPVPAPAPKAPQEAVPGAGRPLEPAPVPAPQVVPGTRVRVVSAQVPVRVTAGKAVIADGSRPGEVLLPELPGEKVMIEFLDPKTGAALGAVEVLPRETPPVAAVPVAPPPADPGFEVDRVGKVQLVHRTYGVFVRLDPGLSVRPGEEIVICREGREVARTKILRIVGQDETYPDGALVLPRASSIRKGDEVRRPKP